MLRCRWIAKFACEKSRARNKRSGRQSSRLLRARLLLEAARGPGDDILRKLQTSTAGLSAAEVRERLKQYGHNAVAQEERYTRLRLLGKAMVNPLVILLLVLA